MVISDQATLTKLLLAHIQHQANPDRVGCPPLASLEAFLDGRLEWSSVVKVSEHLPHCRECLLELKALGNRIRQVSLESDSLSVGER